jgi:hypothetical protein
VVVVAVAVVVAAIVVAIVAVAVVLTVDVAVIAVVVALNAVVHTVAVAVVLAVVLVVVPHLEAGHPQLAAPLPNVGPLLLLHMSGLLASPVQVMGRLAESSKYSPITSPQSSTRVLYIITTVRNPSFSEGCI